MRTETGGPPHRGKETEEDPVKTQEKEQPLHHERVDDLEAK